MRQKIPYEECHRVNNGIIEKKCSICREWFPMNDDYFYKNKSCLRDGYNTYCKPCSINKRTIYQNLHIEHHNEYTLERYHTNPKDNKSKKDAAKRSREKGNVKKWQQNNPEKMQEYNLYRRMNKSHEITKDEWEYCKEYFNYSCAYCGMDEEEHKKKYGEQLHKEHVDHNGSNKIDNCVPACKSCNSSKHISSLDKWFNKNNSKYTQYKYNKIIKWLEEDWKNSIN